MSHISKPLLLCSAAGFVLFLIIQVFIPIYQLNAELDSPNRTLLTKQEAAKKALAFVQDLRNLHIDITPEEPISPTVIYRSQSTVAGYLSKEDLEKTYLKWDAASPYDIYQVLLYAKQAGTPQVMRIDVHMTSGRIIGFELEERLSVASSLGWSMGDGENEQPVKKKQLALDAKARQSLVSTLLKQMGWTPDQLKLNTSSKELDTVTYHVPDALVGQAKLDVKGVFSEGHLMMLKPFWSIPMNYQTEQLHQLQTATTIYNFGYLWTSIGLSAISLIACIVYRRDIRFRSKTLISLSIVSCGISLLHVWNLLPGQLALQLGLPLDQVNMGLTLAIQAVITVIQGIILYFSLQAGKRLWELTTYKELLPTWRHAAFGDRLVRALWLGILYTGILLGTQTVIFFILENGFHSWSSTDEGQSPINLRIAPLFPLLAWVAAISEDGMYRLFGVGLLNRWIRNPWVAGIVPTLIWAFGHVTYPIYPYYSRPVELLFIGMLFLFIMLKHDWWTAMFAHLMLDNCLMSLSFLLDGTMNGFLIGLAYLVSPVTIVYALAKMHRKRIEPHSPAIY